MDAERESKLVELIQKLERVGLAVLGVTRTKGCVDLCLSTRGKKIAHDWFENCVNVFGDKTPLARMCGRDWELKWVICAPKNRLNIQLELFNTDTSWWMDQEIDALVWLCRLGLTNQYALENKKECFRPELLLHVFSEKQELEKAYGEWLSDPINRNTPFELGRPIPTIFLLQRINFYEWFVFFSEKRSYITEEHPSEIDQTLEIPSDEELLFTFNRYMLNFQTAKEFLEGFLAYQTQAENNRWIYRSQKCNPRARFISFHCCSLHSMMRAVNNFYHLWAEMFERKHNITKMKSKSNRGTPMFLSVAWIALLCHFECIDSSSLTFPYSFKGSCKDIIADYT